MLCCRVKGEARHHRRSWSAGRAIRTAVIKQGRGGEGGQGWQRNGGLEGGGGRQLYFNNVFIHLVWTEVGKGEIQRSVNVEQGCI